MFHARAAFGAILLVFGAALGQSTAEPAVPTIARGDRSDGVTPAVPDLHPPSSPFDRPSERPKNPGFLLSPAPSAPALESHPTTSVPSAHGTTPGLIATPAASPDWVKSASAVDSILQLEIDLAEKSFKDQPSIQNRSALVATYEKALAKSCFHDVLQTLRLLPASSQGECRLFITKTLGINPGNPPAVCAHAGIDAPVCDQAYKAQKIRSHSPNREKSERDGLAELLGEERSQRERAGFARIENEITNLEHSSARGKDPTINARIGALYSGLIQGSCQDITMRLEVDRQAARLQKPGDLLGGSRDVGRSPSRSSEPLPPPTPRRTPRGPLWDLPLAGSLPTPKSAGVVDPAAGSLVPNPGETRVILIPRECLLVLDRALKFDPQLPSAICRKFGVYSPSCIRALRTTRGTGGEVGRIQSERPATQQGLATF